MTIIKYDTAQVPTGPTIFLAGPTVRGHQPHLTSWRGPAVDYLRDSGFEGTVVLPEFTDPKESDKGVLWIPEWEYNWLHSAHVIVFWIPRTRELIGLTTNWEHGYWVAKDPQKLVYGRPDDSYRNQYIDIMWEGRNRNQPIHTTLEATLTAAISKIEQIYYGNCSTAD